MPLSIDDARHCLQRIGFAESPAVVVRTAERDRDVLIESLLDADPDAVAIRVPNWADKSFVTYQSFRDLAPVLRRKRIQELTRRYISQRQDLRSAWLTALVNTEAPLAARATLFWQNHFTTSARRVRYPELVRRQLDLLRTHSLGRFEDLLSGVLRDPAMLLFLDNSRNRRGRLNENFARELLELFTLGEAARYTERDVRELARSLTGLGVDADFAFEFLLARHDTEPKTLLGSTGRFGADEVVELLLERRETAEFLVMKVWREFVSPTPDRQTVLSLARTYRRSGYDMRALLRAVLASDAFWSEANRGVQVKSPVQFVVDTYRALGLRPDEPLSLVRGTDAMAQRLFEPPTVAGWPGGNAWISSHTLLARRGFVNRALRDDGVNLARSIAGVPVADVAAATVPASLAGSLGTGRVTFARALRSLAWNLC